MKRIPWWSTIPVGLSLVVVNACGGTVSGGAGGEAPARVGGSGGSHGTGVEVGAGGAGGARSGGTEWCGTGGTPASPCPVPSAECCEALDQAACNVYGDACRTVEFSAMQMCGGYDEYTSECFLVDVDLYGAEPPPANPCDTNPKTGTGVGANTSMYRILDDGTPEVGLFTYGTCGIHGWYACDEPEAPALCDCAGAIGQGCTTP